MAQVWANFVVSGGGGCTCCNNDTGCYLDIPTFLIDGDSTPFSNSNVAQNFFDNSGAIIGCTSNFPGSPACDCLIESNSNALASIGVESISTNHLSVISSKDSSGVLSYNFLWKAQFSGVTSLNINVAVGTTETGTGVSANVSIYDSASAFVTSNVMTNANVDSFTAWEFWQNVNINSASLYHVLVSVSANAPSGFPSISYNPNFIGSMAFDVCQVRANYGSGYIYCQSGL